MTPRRVLAARVLAVLADGLQLGLLPLFAGGGLSLANDVLDVVVAGAMIALVGWHWAFVPTFLAELLPGVDLVPTWTMAALLATRRGRSEQAAGSVAVPDVEPAGSGPGRAIDVTPVAVERPPGDTGKAP